MEKYSLNNGWLSWLTNCIKTNENNPKNISLYHVGGKEPNSRNLCLEVYFPLPDSVYQEAILDLRQAELEKFGDYYSQRQGGGRPIDGELYSLFEKWKAVGFDSKQKQIFRKQYIDSHPQNPFAKNDFNQAMKRYKRKEK